MILVVTKERCFGTICSSELDSLGILHCVAAPECAVSQAVRYRINAAIIHSHSRDDTYNPTDICRELLTVRPDIKLLGAVRHSSDSPSLYSDIPFCSYQLDLPCSDNAFRDAVTRICPIVISVGHLRIGSGKSNVSLLGYSMPLTMVQYSILRLLAHVYPLSLSTDTVCGFLNGMSQNCLAVHICSLNKKAARLSGRRLVVFSDGNYGLNRYM